MTGVTRENEMLDPKTPADLDPTLAFNPHPDKSPRQDDLPEHADKPENG